MTSAAENPSQQEISIGSKYYATSEVKMGGRHVGSNYSARPGSGTGTSIQYAFEAKPGEEMTVKEYPTDNSVVLMNNKGNCWTFQTDELAAKFRPTRRTGVGVMEDMGTERIIESINPIGEPKARPNEDIPTLRNIAFNKASTVLRTND